LILYNKRKKERFRDLFKFDDSRYLKNTQKDKVIQKLTHHNATSVHQDTIAIHDGVEPMSDCQDRTILKLLFDCYLDQFVRLRIYIRGRLIQHEYLVVSDYRAPDQADQLSLADAEIGAAFVDMSLQI